MKKKFIVAIGVFIIILALKAEQKYSFPVMGDFHYDHWTLHDLEYVHNKYSKLMHEVVRYSMSTEKFSPILLKTVASKINSTTPFVVQLGDFTQGTCGSEELQNKMFKDGFAMVKEAFPNTPFLITKGNHDIRGVGAKKSYDTVVLPFLSRESGQKIDSANFYISKGEDLFIFFDTIIPDLNWLENSLKDNKNYRHIFVFTHYPILPFDYRADHIVFNQKGKERERERIIDMLARANAIVFCAHMHQASYLKYENKVGSFTQFAHNSVWLSENPTVLKELNGAEFYSEAMVENQSHSSAAQKEHRKFLIRSVKPFIRDYYYARSQGYMWVTVDKNIQVDFFSGTDLIPHKRIILR